MEQKSNDAPGRAEQISHVVTDAVKMRLGEQLFSIIERDAMLAMVSNDLANTKRSLAAAQSENDRVTKELADVRDVNEARQRGAKGTAQK